MSENQQKEKDSSRDVVNDIIRIVAMFLVIGVHWFGSLEKYWPQDGASLFIYGLIDKLTGFGVPLFFSLSGYYILGKEITDIKGFYYKRFVRVVVPYLLYAALYMLYFTVYEDHQPALFLKNYIINMLTGNVHGTHWFVYSILGLYFATPFLSKMFRALSDREVMLLYITSVSFGLLNCIFGIFGYKFGINTYVFEGTLLTFMSGYCTQRCLDSVKTEKLIYAAICRIAAIIALFILYCLTGWDILKCVIAGLVVAGNTKQVSESRKTGAIRFLSIYSYSVYLVHAAVISAVFSAYDDWSGKLFGLKVFVGYVVVFAVSFVFTLVFDWLFTNRIIGMINNRKYKKTTPDNN